MTLLVKKCPNCHAVMENKRRLVTINTAGVTASASGDAWLLSSSSADPNSSVQLGREVMQSYWLCPVPDCGMIVMI